MNPRRAQMAAIVAVETNRFSPRVEGIFLAFECQVACDLRTDRDRSAWPYGQAIWDEVYGPHKFARRTG